MQIFGVVISAASGVLRSAAVASQVTAVVN